MVLARIGGGVAALLWLFGAPLAVMAGVPFPSDAQDLIIGVLCSGLGLALLPVAGLLPLTSSGRAAAMVRTGGVACCVGMLLSGVPVTLGVMGKLGIPTPAWVTAPPLLGLIALYAWVAAVSFVSRANRATCWVGALTAAAFFLLFPGFAVADVLSSHLQDDNLLIIPFLIDEMFLWVALPCWLLFALCLDSDRRPQAVEISRPS